MKVIQGSTHQANPRLGGFAGMQCTAMAYTALILAFLRHMPIQHWNTDVIDAILNEGNLVYTNILDLTPDLPARYLMHNELPSNVSLGPNSIHSSSYLDMFYGHITRQQSQVALADDMSSPIESALQQGFQISEYALLTLDSQTIAIFMIDGNFYIYDSHSRSDRAVLCPDGSAVLVEFDSLQELTQFVQTNYDGARYDLTPIVFENGNNEQTSQTNRNSQKRTGTRYRGKTAKNSTNSMRSANRIHPGTENCFADSTQTNMKSQKRPVPKTKIFAPQTTATYFMNSSRIDTKTVFSPTTQNSSIQNNIASNVVINDEAETDSVNVHHIPCKVAKPNIKKKYSSQNLNHVQLPSQNHSYPVKEKLFRQREQKFLTAHEQEYINYIREMPMKECASCHRFLFPSEATQLKGENDVTLSVDLQVGDTLCCFCSNCFSKGKISPICEQYNHLKVADIPPVLCHLNPLERRFISKLHTYMTLVVLPRGGQYAEKGLAIHFPIPLQEIINIFPNVDLVGNLVPVIIEDSSVQVQRCVDMLKILDALIWLKNHNHIYKNIDIKVPPNLNTSSLFLDFDDGITEMSSVPCDYTVPIVDSQRFVADGKLVLPHVDSDPMYLNKIAFGEEMAFPWLFPDGCNGVNYERNIKLSLKKYCQYRLYHKDARWRKDVSYLLSAINMCEQEELLQSVNIVMKVRRTMNSEGTLKNSDVDNLQDNPDILDNSYMFTKRIRGTAAYWKNCLLNLLSMLKCLGPPTLFMTLSSNDNHWVELAMAFTGLPFDEINSPNLQEYIKTDPLLAAIHFERRWNALLKVMKDMKPLGEVEDYFARVEFQCRGSPHLHIFIWLKKRPNLSEDSFDSIVQFIDSIISTKLPDINSDKELHDLVSSLQYHSHSFTCKRPNRPGNCRFGFPYQILEHTRILTNVNITQSKGRFYETARGNNSLFINAYNPTILKLWKANMDIQVVGGSTSAAYYVCSYLCKAEPDDLKLALDQLMQVFQTENLSKRTRLLKLGSVMLKTRKLSAQEAAYRLSKLKLIHSSRKVVFVNTYMKGKRMQRLKTKDEREDLSHESENIFDPNLIDYYHARPSALDKWTLFAFASWYTIIKTTENTSPWQVLCAPFENNAVKLRTKPLVIRTPSFKFDSPDYNFNFLLLHIAHRDESVLLQFQSNILSPKEAFKEKQGLFDTSRVPYSWHCDDLESQITRVRLSQDELARAMFLDSHDYAEDVPDVVSQEFSFMASDSRVSTQDLNDEQQSDLTNIQGREDESRFHNLRISNITEEQLLGQIAMLNLDQSKVFKTIQSHFRADSSDNKLRVFITGGAGVGKSFLLRVICEWLKLATYVRPGSSPVLVAAPTGVAARNVNGHTLHSLLSLPVQHGYEPAYETVSPTTLKKLRNRFTGVHTIVIDEISMVSSNVLSFIDRRLSSIRNCSARSFGDMHVIVFGDFFQLKPVRGRFAFTNSLWSEFEPFFLDQNVRQLQDPRYAQLLNRIRVAKITEEDISLLKTRILTENSPEILHLYPVNRQVREYNNIQQNIISGDSSTIIPAMHMFSDYDAHAGQIATSEFIPEDDRDAGGLPNILTLSIGSRVMLLRNIMTDQGLVNSALGCVHSIQFEENKPIAIYVKFDDPSVGRIFQREQQNNAIAINLYSQAYRCKGRSVNRIQFPLSLSWACTMHKTQGCSLSKAVISIGKEIFEAGQAYVALSRVQTLDGVFLLKFCPDKIRANNAVLQEYKRLRNFKKTDDNNFNKHF